jgi:spore coat polysaccharide biosynthesis protein SpsF (cytidylyltransferase family)
MKIVAIIQARMGSTRLSGKVLKEVMGKPLLWHMLNRLKHSKMIGEIVIATTTNATDDIIVKKVNDWGYKVFRGSENDLLDRYYKTAKKYKADIIVRLTADCPLIDPEIVDQAINEFTSGNYDLVGTSDSFPDGLDVTVYSFKALEKAWGDAKLPSEREHVGPYMVKHPELFKQKSIAFKEHLPHMRWTVDEDRDYMFVKEIFERLYKEGEMFYTEDILKLLKREPRLMEINSGIIRNEGYLKSLKEDEAYQAKTEN